MFHIAANTFKEFIRMKVIYAILFFSILLVFFSLVLAKLSINQGTKIILDFNFAIIEIFGLITTLFLGSYLLYNEINKKTILLVLSKVKSRASFVLGKYLWFAGLLLFMYVFLTLAFIGVCLIQGMVFEFAYIQVLILSYLKILVVLAFIMFFSSFMSPFLGLVCSLLIYLIAHSTPFMLYYVIGSKTIPEWGIAHQVMKIVYYTFPNFHDLSMKEFLFSPHLSAYTDFHFILSTVGGGLAYVALLLSFSVILFTKKEF